MLIVSRSSAYVFCKIMHLFLVLILKTTTKCRGFVSIAHLPKLAFSPCSSPVYALSLLLFCVSNMGTCLENVHGLYLYAWHFPTAHYYSDCNCCSCCSCYDCSSCSCSYSSTMSSCAWSWPSVCHAPQLFAPSSAGCRPPEWRYSMPISPLVLPRACWICTENREKSVQ